MGTSPGPAHDATIPPSSVPASLPGGGPSGTEEGFSFVAELAADNIAAALALDAAERHVVLTEVAHVIERACAATYAADYARLTEAETWAVTEILRLRDERDALHDELAAALQLIETETHEH